MGRMSPGGGTLKGSLENQFIASVGHILLTVEGCEMTTGGQTVQNVTDNN